MDALPHLALLVLGEQGAVEVLQRQLGHSHPLSGVVTHGKGGSGLSRHGHTLLRDDRKSIQSPAHPLEGRFTWKPMMHQFSINIVTCQCAVVTLQHRAMES